jgi:hypothetical protein
MWCDFLEAHARKVYAPELDAELSAAHALAVKIRKGAVRDGDSIRVIYRHGWSRLKKPDQVREAAEVLEEHGWVKVEIARPEKEGGRPSEVLRINPEAITKEAE